MAFCIFCGNQIGDDAKFCPGCGKPATPAAAAAAMMNPFGEATRAPLLPLEFTIHGDNLQVARLKLKPGQEVFAEAGKMLYKTQTVQWETKMQGDSIGQKLWGALKRKVMGESLFMTHFIATAPGEVGFAGDYPGRIQAFELPAGKSWLVQRDCFLAAQHTVQLNIAFVKKLGAGFLGGEGFILEKLTGPGVVFIHAGGDHIEFDLAPGELLQVDTGCIVGFEESVSYDIQFVGGIKKAIFGGEGLFLANVTGPGRVIIQSMTLDKLRRELGPVSGGEERGPLGAIGGLAGILGSED
ncbi:MAG: TIGR00266 family protein [Acidobacteria bacterium]|nr:TIGR00266 family protein [Acidobacteriota bacterium]